LKQKLSGVKAELAALEQETRSTEQYLSLLEEDKGKVADLLEKRPEMRELFIDDYVHRRYRYRQIESME
jgi:hypothetical protein